MFGPPRQGVQIPAGQLQEDGIAEPKTVLHIAPAQMVAVQYADEHGKKHNTVLLKVGDTVYHAPDGERWAAGLKQASGWLANAVIAEIDSGSVSVPDKDNVDIYPQDSVSVAAADVSKELNAEDKETPE